MGSGNSEGNQTTIGFYETQQVNTAFNDLAAMDEKNIILFGTSKGAVAITKAMNDYKMNPISIIIKCPFRSMKETVQFRFKKMGIPDFPMADLLIFWGGLQNNFNAFKHNSAEYAKNKFSPVLLLYGQLDDKVSEKKLKKCSGIYMAQKN